jgi:hypothetical protein
MSGMYCNLMNRNVETLLDYCITIQFFTTIGLRSSNSCEHNSTIMISKYINELGMVDYLFL